MSGKNTLKPRGAQAAALTGGVLIKKALISDVMLFMVASFNRYYIVSNHMEQRIAHELRLHFTFAFSRFPPLKAVWNHR